MVVHAVCNQETMQCLVNNETTVKTKNEITEDTNFLLTLVQGVD